MVVQVVAGAALRGVASGAAKGTGGAATEAGHARALQQARQSPAARAADNAGRLGHASPRDNDGAPAQKKNMLPRALRRTPAGRALRTLSASPFSLAKQVRLFADIPYGVALAAAILKDLLDYIGVGSLPAIGTIITILVSILIGLMMLLAGSYDTYRATRRILLRYMILIGTTVSEFFFGLNFIPIETFGVILIYLIVLADRARTAKRERREQRLIAQEGV